jgi:hypothetical protein
MRQTVGRESGHELKSSSDAAGHTSIGALSSRPVRLLGMVVAALAMLLSFVVPSAVAIAPPAAPTATEVPDSATSLKLSWSAVTGAKGYRLQYSTDPDFGSATQLPSSTSAEPLTDTSAVVDGLSTGQRYYFRVAVVDPDSLRVLSNSYSKAVSAAATYPHAAPGDLTASAVTKSSMRLSWKAVAKAPGYTVRVYTKGAGAKLYATTTNSISLSGLKANTLHYVRAYVSRPGARLSADSPENQVTTSTYSTPSPDALRVASRGPWGVKLSWNAVGRLPAGARYLVSYSRDVVPTTSAVVRGPFTTPAAGLGGLSSNTTYFAMVYVADRNNKRISGFSDFVVVKTLVPRGTISGRSSGVSGNDLTASAYTTTGELADQTTIGRDGQYSLSVRPGNYRVQIGYTGTGSFASAWARSGRAGGRVPSEASIIKVAMNKTTTAPAVKIGAGAIVSGVVRDAAGRPVRDVDVAAITFMSREREVEVVARSGADGRYTVRGLPDGKHWLRYIYSGDGFKNRSVEVIITKGKITSVRVSTSAKASTATVRKPFTAVNVRLDNANFRKRYKAYINGTRRTGRTLSIHATPWLAGSYPTTRASMSYQWKRNGKAIKGATRAAYRLGKADKGQRITVTATARRYGYNTGSTTSKATAKIK